MIPGIRMYAYSLLWTFSLTDVCVTLYIDHGLIHYNKVFLLYLHKPRERPCLDILNACGPTNSKTDNHCYTGMQFLLKTNLYIQLHLALFQNIRNNFKFLGLSDNVTSMTEKISANFKTKDKCILEVSGKIIPFPRTIWQCCII